MSRVLALVEGPTERNFGQRVLAPFLGSAGVFLHPRVIGKPGHKGGVRNWEQTRKEIVGLMTQEPESFVTTMFDFYRLPSTWPGRAEATRLGLANYQAVEFIEAAIAADLAQAMGAGFDPSRFFSYLQLHEYEALLFSDPAALASVTGGETDAAAHARQFEKIVADCAGCELIDEGPATSPAKRIVGIAKRYVKAVDGILAAERISLQTMREKCPHFSAWVQWLLSTS